MLPKQSSARPPEKEYDKVSDSDETYSSTSDGEDEGAFGKPSCVMGTVEEDDYKAFEKALEDEYKQVAAVAETLNLTVSEGKNDTESNLIKCIHALDFFNSIANAAFQDILPQIIDGRKFIIDGDSLLMFALKKKGLSMEAGGQTLHVLYIVERFLQTFVSRGLNFTIVFFEVWDPFWRCFPSISIARNCLLFHFQHNQKKFPVLTMKSLWSNQFADFTQSQKPGFIMMATSLPRSLEIMTAENLAGKSKAARWLQFICGSQSFFCEFLCLDVVDISSVFSSVTCLMGMVHVHVNNFKGLQRKIEKMLKTMEKQMPTLTSTHLKTWDVQNNDVKNSVTLGAAVATLNKNVNRSTESIVKIILLSTAIAEFTPLKLRCFKNLPKLPQYVNEILSDFLGNMGKLLGSLHDKSDCHLDFKRVGDLWQGLFFKAVFSCVLKDGGLKHSKLESVIAHRYEEMVSSVNVLLQKKKLDPYPILVTCEEDAGVEKVAQPTQLVASKSIHSSELLHSTCELVNLFCGEFCSDSRFVSYTSTNSIESEKETNSFLHESRHWHSKRILSDEYERIPENKGVSKEDKNSWWALKQRNAMARYLTLYGSSLEGRSAPKNIIVNPAPGRNPSSKKYAENSKTQSKVKQSKKDKIIEENTRRIREEKQKLLRERLKKSFKVIQTSIVKRDYDGVKEKCDIELSQVKEFSDLTMDILFMKGEACFGMWKNECHKKSLRRNLAPVKDLFLVTREIFKLVEQDGVSLSAKQKNVLFVWIHELGFHDFLKVKGLLEGSSKNPDDLYHVGMNHVEFQLTQLGAELLRDTGAKYDPRVEGFIPDPWQTHLFDIIDKNQCAVVVAPTSSGKTYACYYCMEKVIRESDDGIVVYVCPTKALVNQVHATIYARFRKNLSPGKALLGVFTRDYRENDKNCQILVTVPECMELLLVGPRSLTWSKRIKYVIFDEVHCLVGQGGGAAWENSILLIRCPFLALSATIQEPEKFCAWLQQVEMFKKTQIEKFGLVSDRSSSSYKVNLVEHSDRHNHLLKNVMKDDGTIQHVHPYSFLNIGNQNDNQGIPAHIVLSPGEAHELYLAMKSIIPAKRLESVSLLKYFQSRCPSGYLSMQAVKKFSDDLRDLLQKEDVEHQIEVLKLLGTVDFSELETGTQFVLKKIPQVMASLKESGMLPAIIFTYSRKLVEALPEMLLMHLRHLDDFPEDEDTDIESDSDADDTKTKGGNKERRRKRGEKYFRKLGLMRGPSMLKSKGSLRGEGHIDEKVIKFIEHRLLSCGHRAQHNLPCLLRRGLGKHYGAMNNKERSAVEMLFRSRVLNLVAATGTLALGIHMPCKTVVIAGDSPYLNVLEFHQMSGRAGRRGYDKEGNVVFFGLNRRKVETLMTGNLPQMIGNFPLSVTLILRLFLLVSDATYAGESTKESKKEALARAYTLLENGLLYQTQPFLKDRMKMFCFFVVQLLRRLNLLSLDGHLHPHAAIVTHLHYKEPGNFAFYYLLKAGVLEEICLVDKRGNVTEESLHNLLVVLNFLFARLPVSDHLLKQERYNSIVILPQLPGIIYKKLEEYNSVVLGVFSHYFKCMSVYVEEKYGKETTLPLSNLLIEAKSILPEGTYGQDTIMSTLNELHTRNYVCSVFAGLSGNTDQDLFPMSGELSHIRDDLNVKIVPTIELEFDCNSYALDFYKHGNKVALCHDNGLKSGYDFEVIRDFMLVLKCLFVSLSEMSSSDEKLLKAFDKLSKVFEIKFKKAYSSRRGQ